MMTMPDPVLFTAKSIKTQGPHSKKILAPRRLGGTSTSDTRICHPQPRMD